MNGWVYNKKFIECRPFEHLYTAMNNSTLSALIPGLSDLRNRVSAARDSCEALSARGEHPEWHYYENALDDANDECWHSLIKAGCVRVGKMGDTVFFEGRPEALKENHDFCVALAGDHNTDFEPIEP